MIAASCMDELSQPDENAGSGDFVAYTDSAPESKTYTDETLNIRWISGDEVSVFAGSTLASKYYVSDSSDGKTSATLKKYKSSTASFGAGTEIYSNVAYYPYSDNLEVEMADGGYVIYADLPQVQYYSQDSFGQDAFPMVAVTDGTDDHDLSFKNLCGVMEISLTGDVSVTSISLAGNNGECLCGDAVINAAYGEIPQIDHFMSVPLDPLTLNCGSGVALDSDEATSFMIVVPPVDFEQGFTVVVTASDGTTMTVQATAENVIERNDLLRMPALAYVADPAPDVDAMFIAYDGDFDVDLMNPAQYCDYCSFDTYEAYYTYERDNFTFVDLATELESLSEAGCTFSCYDWSSQSEYSVSASEILYNVSNNGSAVIPDSSEQCNKGVRL